MTNLTLWGYGLQSPLKIYVSDIIDLNFFVWLYWIHFLDFYARLAWKTISWFLLQTILSVMECIMVLRISEFRNDSRLLASGIYITNGKKSLSDNFASPELTNIPSCNKIFQYPRMNFDHRENSRSHFISLTIFNMLN